MEFGGSLPFSKFRLKMITRILAEKVVKGRCALSIWPDQ
jgi:hypothetical protein